MMFWGIIIITLICSSQLLLYTHANRAMGIPDVAFLFMDDIIIVTCAQVLFIPLFTLMALLCPKGQEGTVFCVYTALMNAGGNLSSIISGMLMGWLGITAHNFDNMVSMRIITLALNLIPCLMISFIPADEEMEKLIALQKEADEERSGAVAPIVTQEPEV